MVGSLLVAGYFTFVHDALAAEPVALVPPLAAHMKLVWGALVTSAIWVVGTLVTPPESEETLRGFVEQVRPGGPGWRRFAHEGTWAVPQGLVAMGLGSAAVYSALFATGSWLYGDGRMALVLGAMALVAGWGTWKWGLR